MGKRNLPAAPEIGYGETDGLPSRVRTFLPDISRWAVNMQRKLEKLLGEIDDNKVTPDLPIELPTLLYSEIVAGTRYRPGGKGALVYVPDAPGGASIAYRDGTAWRLVGVGGGGGITSIVNVAAGTGIGLVLSVVSGVATIRKLVSATAALVLATDVNNNTTFTLSNATTGAAGLLSGADKTKLDGLLPGAVATLPGDLGAVTSATLADTAGLALPLAANTLYAVEARIRFQTNNAATGLKCSLTWVGTATYEVEIPAIAAGNGRSYGDRLTASGTAVTAPSSPASGINYIARVSGMVSTVGTAGTLQFQHASGNGTNSVTIKGGSYLMTTVIG